MLNLNYYPALTLLITALSIASCSSSEIGESKDVSPETIYQDYSVNYDESENEQQVTIRAQFRFAGSDGTTLVLTKPSSISLDEQQIKVDSSEFAGAYYSIDVPAKGFMGKHRFVFTGTDNARFENEFSLDDLKLLAPVRASRKDSLDIQFDAGLLEADDYIELSAINTDSSFSISHTVSAQGNTFTVPVKELKRQKGNMLMLVASVRKKIALKQSTKEGGQIVIYHSSKPVSINLFD